MALLIEPSPALIGFLLALFRQALVQNRLWGLQHTKALEAVGCAVWGIPPATSKHTWDWPSAIIVASKLGNGEPKVTGSRVRAARATWEVGKNTFVTNLRGVSRVAIKGVIRSVRRGVRQKCKQRGISRGVRGESKGVSRV